MAILPRHFNNEKTVAMGEPVHQTFAIQSFNDPAPFEKVPRWLEMVTILKVNTIIREPCC